MNSIEEGEDRTREVKQKRDLLRDHRMRVDEENRDRSGKREGPRQVHDQGESNQAQGSPHDHREAVDLTKGRDTSAPATAWKEDDDAIRESAISQALKKRYLIANKIYYFRDDEGKVAFEDKGKRIATELDDPGVARSMVELAVAKEWKSIKVNGTNEFKREVWLAASARDMEVSGYRPTDLDLAKLEELRHHRPARPKNEILQGVSRDHAVAAEPDKSPHQQPRSDQAHTPARDHLTAKQEQTVDVLKQMLRARGDSDAAIDMAAAAAADKFKNDRVYVGKIVQSGAAPFEHDPENDPSYFVKLQGPQGEKTVWGVDLPRALREGEATKGDEISLTYQGMQMVVVEVKELDAAGRPTGHLVEKAVERNTWNVSKLDKLQEIARERAGRAADMTKRSEGKQPRLNVFDKDAPRRDSRDPAGHGAPNRTKQKEPSVPR